MDKKKLKEEWLKKNGTYTRLEFFSYLWTLFIRGKFTLRF